MDGVGQLHTTKAATDQRRRRAPTHTPEAEEGRALAKGKAVEHARVRTQRRSALQHALDRLCAAVRRECTTPLTALWHPVYNMDRLREAYYGVHREAAPGSEGQTWTAYGEHREENLRDLADRLKQGVYHTSPVARVAIPKPDGRQRPIGKPTVEGQIVQRATVEVHNALCEEDCRGSSYGFRPGRNPHDALDAVTVWSTKRTVNGDLDADLRGACETLDQAWLVPCVEPRLGDRRVVRHLRTWLQAGGVGRGEWHAPEEGTPPGCRVSRLAANIDLHYVLTLWADRWRRQHARGEVISVRHGDACIVGFEHRDDAKRVWTARGARFQQCNLEPHHEKTQLIACGRYAAERRQRRGPGTPKTLTAASAIPPLCGTR